MDSEDDRIKVRVDLPNHWAVGGESMWARPLGSDLYELDNVPFHAYDLNCLDVVEAVAENPEREPSVLRVVKRSGHLTLRLVFHDITPEVERVTLLKSLAVLGASFEGADHKLFAIDVAPTGDYQAVRGRLDEWVDQGMVDYETCEARIPGSFDARPSDDEGGPG